MQGPRMMVALDASAAMSSTPLSLPGKPEPLPHRPASYGLGAGSDAIEIVPFYTIRDEPYTTYLLNRQTA
jgi:hypothetical protein